MPQHTVRIIDSSGNPGRMKLKRVRAHESQGNGKFNEEGVFVFPRHHCQPIVRYEGAGEILKRHRVSLADLLGPYPNHDFARDAHWSDLRAALPVYSEHSFLSPGRSA